MTVMGVRRIWQECWCLLINWSREIPGPPLLYHERDNECSGQVETPSPYTLPGRRVHISSTPPRTTCNVFAYKLNPPTHTHTYPAIPSNTRGGTVPLPCNPVLSDAHITRFQFKWPGATCVTSLYLPNRPPCARGDVTRAHQGWATIKYQL